MSKEQEFAYASDAERPAPSMVRAFLRAKDSEPVISQCLAALGIKDNLQLDFPEPHARAV